jgi:2-keto-3-deoxy-L-rhamnonate aldolase RhmA
MPDVTVSFTDAQWARIVAATSYIVRGDEGVVNAAKLAAKWKAQVTNWVKAYEESLLSTDDF